MYLKNLILRNYGPVANFKLECAFDNAGSPKPLIIVGENGSGKSILLSHIINGLMQAQQESVSDPELENGKAYKLRSQKYIRVGESYSYGKVVFEDGLEYEEWALRNSRSDYEKTHMSCPILSSSWQNIPEDGWNHFSSTFPDKKVAAKSAYNNNVVLFFPPNRFEDPAWLNILNLEASSVYEDRVSIEGLRNRNILAKSPLSDLKNWILDVLYDRNVRELKLSKFPLPQADLPDPLLINIFQGFDGEASNLYVALLAILRKILKEDDQVRFGIGHRRSRSVEIMKNEQSWVPNIFQLSSGQLALIDLFFSIIRDADYCHKPFISLSDLRGIVVVDEVDLHLHTDHQHEVLPDLIKIFPNIQFILTTHSPFFVMGLERSLGSDGFSLIQMPDGVPIETERFSEFENAYSAFKESRSFSNDVREILRKSRMPLVFVEGKLDVQYLRKAARHLGREDLLEKFEIDEKGGSGNLDKIWKSFSKSISDLSNRRVLLLYDCDVENRSDQKLGICRRGIPMIAANPLKKGIENLFSLVTLTRAISVKPELIDIRKPSVMIVRGVEQNIPEEWTANENEKGNLCSWLCAEGAAADFSSFSNVFDLIEDWLQSDGSDVS